MKNAKEIQKLESMIETSKQNLERMSYLESSECFLSVHVERLQISKFETQIRLLENDGCDWFLVLTDLNGQTVSEKIVKTKYGKAFIIENADGSVKFVDFGVRESTLAKKGYKVTRKLFKAVAKISGDHVITYRTFEENR